MSLPLPSPYVVKYKPKSCPQCLSTAISTYVFGYPDEVVVADQQLPALEQKYQIGGCSIQQGEFAKSWHCKACGMDFYKKNNNVYREQAK